MIFVTVGTHEQQFNRLIRKVDELKQDGVVQEVVEMQTGYCTYEPKYCKWKQFLPYQEMVEKVQQAEIVITHGGPSSFIMPLQFGKIPIVVPRQKKYEEHVNDHQIEFAKAVAERQGNIIPVYDIDELEDTIQRYSQLVEQKKVAMCSNNQLFNEELEKIVKGLFP